MKKILVFGLLLTIVSCANQESQHASTEQVAQSLEDQINTMIDSDQYTEALALLEEQEETPETQTLTEKTYLNYGLFLVYRDSDVTNMREKMNGALRQFIEVLKINPDNEKAITEVEQILGIYSTFPDRSPDPDVTEALEELGF